MRTARYYKVRSIVRGAFWSGALMAVGYAMGMLYLILTGGVF